MLAHSAARLQVIHVPCPSIGDDFAGAVASGLGARPRRLPCRFFYDTNGSRLFEQICALPEYYPTRTEDAILREHAPEILAAIGGDIALAEFGSGNSSKTRILIEALLQRQERLAYAPIDISVGFLETSARSLLDQYRGLWLTAIGGEYHDAVPHLPRHSGPRLVLFLGGNIGNMNEPQAVSFLARVCRELEPHDRILVGFDRLKSLSILLPAYNDAAGVTAAFNKNLLGRINRELGGEFDLASFEHQGVFVNVPPRMEMRLVSTRRQLVRVGALGRSFAFAEGEAIHTEDSHKYEPGAFERLAAAAGLRVAESWSDLRQWFSLVLLARGDGDAGANSRAS